MSYVSAIVLAAGRGLRCKSDTPKPLISIKSKPLMLYCLGVLNRHPSIKDIILVVSPKNFKDIIRKTRQYRIKKLRNVVLGGILRQDSVINGLKAINPATDLVLVHDGVRPFIDAEIVSRLIKEAKKYGAAITGVPVKATIKRVKGQGVRVKEQCVVEETLDRSNLWEIQTPQVFKKDLILKAYEKFGNIEVTDDASLVEKLGVKVRVVLGSCSNIKITTPEDLVLAEAISRSGLLTSLLSRGFKTRS